MRFPVLVLFALLNACAPAVTWVPEGAAFAGPVLEVSGEDDNPGTPLRLLVQAERPGRTTGRIWVTILSDSQLRWRSGEPAKPSNLRRGIEVAVWTDIILTSDPGQASANLIEIQQSAPR